MAEQRSCTPASHHEHHTLERGVVGERFAVDGDQVGVHAGGKRADAMTGTWSLRDGLPVLWPKYMRKVALIVTIENTSLLAI